MRVRYHLDYKNSNIKQTEVAFFPFKHFIYEKRGRDSKESITRYSCSVGSLLSARFPSTTASKPQSGDSIRCDDLLKRMMA